MRIIGLSALLFFFALAQAAEETPLSGLAGLAQKLSQSDAYGSLDYFDNHMKAYDVIERNVAALTEQAELACSIDIITDEVSGEVHKLDVDWFLQLKSQTDDSLLERRRERVHLEMRLVKAHWKITAFSPVKIFDPIQIPR